MNQILTGLSLERSNWNPQGFPQPEIELMREARGAAQGNWNPQGSVVQVLLANEYTTPIRKSQSETGGG